RQSLGTGWVSYQLQETVADLWSSPEAVQHAPQGYAARRAALLAALSSHGVAASGRAAVSSWVPGPGEGRVGPALASARGAGAAAPGGGFRIGAPPGVGICFSPLHEDEAGAFAADSARALHARAARLD